MGNGGQTSKKAKRGAQPQGQAEGQGRPFFRQVRREGERGALERATSANNARLRDQLDRMQAEYVDALTEVAREYQRYLDEEEAFDDDYVRQRPEYKRDQEYYRREAIANIIWDLNFADVERRYQEAIRRYREVQRGQTALL